MAQITTSGNIYVEIPFVRGISIAARAFIPLTIETPIPGTIILTNITLPKRVTMTQVPTVAGCMAPESNYEPIQLKYNGVISSDTPEEFRALVDEMLDWLAGEVTLEIWPGRYCNARVQEHTLDPHWPGVNDTFVTFKFDAIIPDGFFYDTLGNIYRTP